MWGRASHDETCKGVIPSASEPHQHVTGTAIIHVERYSVQNVPPPHREHRHCKVAVATTFLLFPKRTEGCLIQSMQLYFCGVGWAGVA